MKKEYHIGQTLVEVSLPNKQHHDGIVVQETTTHLRVYRPENPERDVNQVSSELFAKDFCTIVGQLSRPIRIEPQLL